MKDWLGRLISMVDTWWNGGPPTTGDLGMAFGFAQAHLEANREGLLSPAQYPPMSADIIGFCAVGIAVTLLLRWTIQQRAHAERLAFGFLCLLVLLLPASLVAGKLHTKLLDRKESRACEFTGISSGLVNSPLGFGVRHLTVGNRKFRAHNAASHAHSVVKAGKAYRIFYACHSETLASVESAPGFKPAKLAQHQLDLAELLDFGLEDLATNQAGSVASNQQPWTAAIFAFLLVVSGAAGGYQALRHYKASPVMSLAFGPAFLAVSALFAYSSFPIAQDIVQRRVCQVTGNLTYFKAVPRGRYPDWMIGIANESIHVPNAGPNHSLLRIGNRYRIYYLCHSKLLASMEPLDS